MTGKENKIIPLVKTEEKDKKISIQSKKG
jgi:hypothetical protein